jgi:hypothetical protein
MRTKAWILAVCSGLLLAAACSDSGGPSRGGPAEKTAVISAGDAVCKQVDAAEKQALDTFKSSHPNPSEAETLDFFTTVVLPIEDSGVGSMHRIGEPTKDRTEFDAAIKELDQGLSDFKAEIGDDPLTVLKSGSKAFDKANGLLKAYGFTECGKS